MKLYKYRSFELPSSQPLGPEEYSSERLYSLPTMIAARLCYKNSVLVERVLNSRHISSMALNKHVVDGCGGQSVSILASITG